MPSAIPSSEFLPKLSIAWSDSDFLDRVSRAASMSIHREILDGESRAADADGMHEVAQLARNATVLSFMTEVLAAGGGPVGGLPEEAQGGAHRLAKLWESLSKICQPAAKGEFSLNAACSYELAGYQANARCMARLAEASRSGRDDPCMDGLVGAFLQRRLVQVRFDCRRAMAEPDYEKTDNISYRLALASAAAALHDFSGSLLSGSAPDMESIAADLDDAKKLFYMSGFPAESSLAHSAKSVMGSMWSRSTWSALVDTQGCGGPVWNRYLVLLARGLGSPVPSGSSISEMWPSQIEAIAKGLLSSNESKIVRMPTSTGKTRIAEMSILHALTGKPTGAPRSRCVYVAPYRALVSEVTRSLSLVFPDLGFTVSGLDGSYEATPLDMEGEDGPDILVTTPEKLDAVARTSPKSLDGTALFVIDEGHVVGMGSRGARIEMFLTRLRRRFAKSRFILLSAMLSDNAMRRYAAWLHCGGASPSTDGIITTEWRPTMQRVAKLEWARGICKLVYEPLKINPQQRETVNDPIVRSKFQYVDKNTGRIRTRRFPSSQKGEIAAEIAFRHSSLGPVLVYSTTPKNAMSVARKLHERVVLAREAKQSVPDHFEVRDRRSAGVSAEWLGPDHTVTRLLRSGVAVHHGGLPHALRQAIEVDVSRGEIAAITATNTLSQGVNLPVRTIVVHSCRRYDKDDDLWVPIPASEYWNLAGRAGRAGQETEGTIIHIVTTPTDARDFRHYVSARDTRDEADGGLGRILKDLARDRISDDDLARAMDPDILGIMVEEGVRDGCEDIVKEVVVRSLSAQSLRDDSGIRKACDRIKSRAISIGNGPQGRVSDDILRACGGTGLGMHSCRRLIRHVEENEGDLRRLLAPEGSRSTFELARLIMGALGEVSEMDDSLEYSGDRDALLKAWMGGETAHSALKKVGALGEDAEDAARFIWTAFGQYAPWGISAFVRLAAARLGIPCEGLPGHARYLPEMVRYGVPAPEHTWAMRLGIATKSAAMSLCERLRPSTPRELARLVADMGVEDLAGHGIGADMAADAARAALCTYPNPLLREGLGPEEAMCRPVHIIGSGEDRWYASRLAAGDEVEVRRDYDDTVDRNAMAAYAGGRHIGYVERHMAQYLAPLVDAGMMEVSARVVRAEGGGGGDPPRITVLISARPPAAGGAGKRPPN